MDVIRLNFLCCFLCAITLHAYGQESAAAYRFYNDFEDPALNASWMNPATIGGDDTNHFSRTDAANPYSAGIEVPIPEKLQRKNFSIHVKGSLRTTDINANSQLVITISKNDSQVFWKGFHLAADEKGAASWTEFRQDALIPQNISPGCRLKIFVWNADGKAVVLLDNFEIILKEEKFPSYLPE